MAKIVFKRKKFLISFKEVIQATFKLPKNINLTFSRSFLGLVFLLTLCILPVMIFHFYMSPVYPDAAKNYILSSLSQVLAAVFALTFTIVLVVVQLVTGYSSRLAFANKRMLWYTLTYLFLFIQAIMLPLVALRNPTNFFFYASLFEGFFALILLPFFLLFLFRELSPDNLLRNLTSEIVSIIRKRQDPDNELKALSNYLMRSFRSGDYGTGGRGIEYLINLIEEIAKDINQWEFINIPYNIKWLFLGGSCVQSSIIHSIKERTVLNCFTQIIHSCTVAGQDPYIPLILLSTFNYWGLRLLEKKNRVCSGIVNYHIIACSVMLLLCIERKYLDSIWWLLNFFQQAGSYLSRLKRKELKGREQVYIDFLCGILCASASIEMHTPEFGPFASKIKTNAYKKFGKKIQAKAKSQALQFLSEVFPELPNSVINMQ